ncbi:MAG: hypothetical protein QXY22_00745 [Candidatus Nitrosotenuis sp.]
MKKTVVFALLVAFAFAPIPASATHISKPVVVEPKTEYILGEKVAIRGWVNYNEVPTADVLLNFKVTGHGGVLAERSFPSDDTGNFTFEFETRDLEPGRYDIVITSHCLEVHRQICTYQSQTLSVNLQDGMVPGWIKNSAKWWSEGAISDSDFVQGIQYLIKNNIIVVSKAAQQETGPSQIPGWIKNSAKWWSEGRIPDSDFVSGIQYMVEKGIIRL